MLHDVTALAADCYEELTLDFHAPVSQWRH
jgi:hypothetical protein